MSQFPPPPPPSTSGYDSTIPYHSANAKTSSMALTSMILGILAIPLGCFGIGLILGIIAVVLGIIALSAISKNPVQYGGRGFAITGIITGGVGTFVMLPLLIAILLPSLGKARELSNRSVCAANLRGISQSMCVYAADNMEAFPIVSNSGGYGLASAGAGKPDPNVDHVILSQYTASPAPSVTQNMWLLVLEGQVAPKQFICKSDPAPTVTALADPGGIYQINFNDGTKPSDFTYSYSFAYPWTATTGEIGGWWRNTTDASIPLLADMVPLEGTGSPAATPGKGMDKNANSFNHQRDGQNVAFGDAHVEFSRNAAVGQNNDNIFAASRGTPNPVGTPANGKIPDIGLGGIGGAWDICLVPAANASTGYSRK